MKTFFVIRSGWNAANQPALGCRRNPKNQFESNQYMLVGIIAADSEESAVSQVNATCYNNQRLFATANSRSIKGLTAAIRHTEEYA